MINIRPVSDLRNKYPEIEELVLKEDEAVYLTKNGYGSMVVMSLEKYSKLISDREYDDYIENALDEADRGFSFHKDAPLDMRMNRDQSLNAYDVINTYSANDLTKILKTYGEEKYANSIAKGIVKAREIKPIQTTLELTEIIKENVPEKYRRVGHPARKTFQAIRIEVNDELNVFKNALKDSLDLINKGGRICVITFHSLEDRICKQIFNEVSKLPKELQNLPIIPDEYKPKFKIIANIEPTKEEIERNPRSRSARLRVIERS